MTLPPRGAASQPTVVFLGFTALSVGSGTEQFLLNTVHHAPLDRFRVVVVQTDFAPSRRWSDEYVRSQLGSVEVVNLRTPRRSYDPDQLIEFASTWFGAYLGTLLTLPPIRAIFAAQSRRRNRDVLRSIESADLIYLVRNEDRAWLKVDPSRTVVVGSTHCDDLSGGLLAFRSLRGRELLARLFRAAQARTRSAGPPVDAYHVTQDLFWNERIQRTPRDRFIPLGVDTGQFTPGPARPAGHPVRFLFVGGIEAQKGIDRLLAAWARVTTPGAELHIVGGGRLSGRVTAQAREDPRIHYHGILSPDALTEMYASCDIFVFPSRYETLGLVVLEALSSGLQVVASEALRGVFDPFRDMGALEYLSTTPYELAGRLNRLASDPPHDVEWRTRLHRAVESQCAWERVSSELFGWFQELLEAPRGRPLA